MASSASRASWVVAASVGAVEAMKDQAGLCRWNYVLRSLHQHARNSLGSISQAANHQRRTPSFAAAAAADGCFIDGLRKEEKSRQSEESLRKVMYLSCWGPN